MNTDCQNIENPCIDLKKKIKDKNEKATYGITIRDWNSICVYGFADDVVKLGRRTIDKGYFNFNKWFIEMKKQLSFLASYQCPEEELDNIIMNIWECSSVRDLVITKLSWYKRILHNKYILFCGLLFFIYCLYKVFYSFPEECKHSVLLMLIYFWLPGILVVFSNFKRLKTNTFASVFLVLSVFCLNVTMCLIDFSLLHNFIYREEYINYPCGVIVWSLWMLIIIPLLIINRDLIYKYTAITKRNSVDAG